MKQLGFTDIVGSPWRYRRIFFPWATSLLLSTAIVGFAQARFTAGTLALGWLVAACALPTAWGMALILLPFRRDWLAGVFPGSTHAPEAPSAVVREKTFKQIFLDEHPLRKRWQRQRNDDLWEPPRPGDRKPGYSWLVQWLPRPLQGLAHFLLLLAMLVALMMLPQFWSRLTDLIPDGTRAALEASFQLVLLGLVLGFVGMVAFAEIASRRKARRGTP